MIIEISDSVSGFTRKKLIMEKVMIYAVENFKGDRARIANFLDLSQRSISRISNENPKIRIAFKKEKFKKLIKKYKYDDIKNTKFYLYSSSEDKKLILQIDQVDSH